MSRWKNYWNNFNTINNAAQEIFRKSIYVYDRNCMSSWFTKTRLSLNFIQLNFYWLINYTFQKDNSKLLFHHKVSNSVTRDGLPHVIKMHTKSFKLSLVNWSNMLLIYFWFFHLSPKRLPCTCVAADTKVCWVRSFHRVYPRPVQLKISFACFRNSSYSSSTVSIPSGGKFRKVLWNSRTKYLTNLPISLVLNPTEPIVTFQLSCWSTIVWKAVKVLLNLWLITM